MHKSLETRIAALEKKNKGDSAFKVVIMRYGETEAEARKRYGIAQDTDDIVFILRFSQMSDGLEERQERVREAHVEPGRAPISPRAGAGEADLRRL